MGMRIIVSCRELAGVSWYAGLLAPLGPRNFRRTPLRPSLLGGPAQMNLTAIEF